MVDIIVRGMVRMAMIQYSEHRTLSLEVQVDWVHTCLRQRFKVLMGLRVLGLGWCFMIENLDLGRRWGCLRGRTALIREMKNILQNLFLKPEALKPQNCKAWISPYTPSAETGSV